LLAPTTASRAPDKKRSAKRGRGAMNAASFVVGFLLDAIGRAKHNGQAAAARTELKLKAIVQLVLKL